MGLEDMKRVVEVSVATAAPAAVADRISVNLCPYVNECASGRGAAIREHVCDGSYESCKSYMGKQRYRFRR